MDNQALHIGLSSKNCGCPDEKTLLEDISGGNAIMSAAVCEISFNHDHLSLSVCLKFTVPDK